MADISPESLWDMAEGLRNSSKRPLIHCIMNYVAAADCANIVLAAGAKPVMADCAEETAEIAAKASAVVLNMGTFSPERGNAMINAAKAAESKCIPVILDPVGLSASVMRKNWFERMMNELKISAVKGNLHEIRAAAGIEESDERLVRAAAERYGCSVMLTGSSDFIADESGRAWRIDNGTEILSAVTGTGCMTGALAGAFAAYSGNAAAGCAAAVALMDICGEIAAEETSGTGSFRVRLFDLISQIKREEYLGRIRIREL